MHWNITLYFIRIYNYMCQWWVNKHTLNSQEKKSTGSWPTLLATLKASPWMFCSKEFEKCLLKASWIRYCWEPSFIWTFFYVLRDLQLSLLSTENVVSAEVLSKQISVPLGEHPIKWSAWGLLRNVQISCFPSSFGTSWSFLMWGTNRNPEDAWMIL